MKTEKINKLLISPETSLIQCLVKMDEVGHKLLIIVQDEKYVGLISIGDIQRAIIKNHPLDTPIREVLRDNYIIAKEGDDLAGIKREMIDMRLEFMPVINKYQTIIDIYFYSDIVSQNIVKSESLDVPVVIMAGGYGTRLKPLTNIIPKPLVPIGDKSILEIIIESFKKAGSSKFYLSVNYKSEMIKFYLDSIDHGVDIEYFKEDVPCGTAGSLNLLKDHLNETFFVSNSDIIIKQDYKSIFDYHKDNKNELTLVASLKNYDIPYGTVESGEHGELLSIKEKPKLTFMINCGLYILEPHLLNEIPEFTFFHITDLIDGIKKRKGKVGVFPISEKSWIDIGEWKEYQKVLGIDFNI